MTEHVLTRSDVEAAAKRLIAEQFGVPAEELELDTRFRHDLNADSLDSVELVMDFEDEFDLSIADGDFDALETVGMSIEYVCQRKGV